MDIGEIIAGEKTLAAVDTEMEVSQDTRPRPYLGASAIGKDCARSLWYGFRWYDNETFDAKTLRNFADGHASEDIMAERLKAVVHLETHDPVTGRQFGLSAIDGHFKGHCDGLLPEGTLESMQPAVWEHKASSEAVFKRLSKAKVEHGEKAALKAWNTTYYAQAQIYMHFFKMKRHYLTCSTAGCRDHMSIRTDYKKDDAEYYLKRAERIIASDSPPPRIAEQSTDYRCKWCSFKEVCFEDRAPQVNCRTCKHSYAAADGGWVCDAQKIPLDREAQEAACNLHEYIQ